MIEVKTKKAPVEDMNEVLLRAKSTRNFETQAHNLSNHFNLSSCTSEAMLLERVYERLLNKDISQVTTNELSWMITWSEKDIERSLSKDTSWYKEHCTNDDVLIDTMPVQDTGYQEITNEQLRQIFLDNRSREFVQSILNVGKEETMQRFELTKHQFNSRLNHKLQYLDNHQQLLDRVLATDTKKEMIKEYQVVQDLLDIINTPTLSDEVINAIIQQAFGKYSFLHDYLDTCTQLYHLKYQGEVVQHFMQGSIDSDKFLCYLYQQSSVLDAQLKGK